MLDLRVIRQNPEKISENCRHRNLLDLVAPLLEQDEIARSLKGELDTLRQRRNAKGWPPTDVEYQIVICIRNIDRVSSGGCTQLKSEPL